MRKQTFLKNKTKAQWYLPNIVIMAVERLAARKGQKYNEFVYESMLSNAEIKKEVDQIKKEHGLK